MEPVDQSPKDAAANADMKRLMGALLPDVHVIFDHITDKVLQNPTAEEQTNRGLAASYRLWHDASVRELITHYNKFELPLTVAAREKEDPNAAETFAKDITRLNVNEAVGEYLAKKTPKLSAEKASEFQQAFGLIQKLASEIDTTGVTSFADRKREDGWRKGV